MCRSSTKVQKRAIFRKEYEGTSLREDLGLARPKTRFFEGRSPENAPVLAFKTLTLGRQKLGCAANAPPDWPAPDSRYLRS
jgi:hypothetical protein